MTPKREHRIREVSAKRQLDLAVILENVHDPHNIAAVVRSCDAIGVQSVFALYTDPGINVNKLRLGKRTTAGARKWVDTYLHTDLDTCIAAVREKCDVIYATALGKAAQSIYDTDFSKSVALVFGNEHGGISNELLEATDGNIYIPQMGMVQSLNISVACAVTLFEILRQRNEAGFYGENPTQTEESSKALLEDWFDRHETQYKGRAVKRVDD